MDILLRVIAIFIEVAILAGVMWALLTGMQLIISDLGVGLKYKRFVSVVLVMIGTLTVVFFIAHLTFLYPVIQAG
jgi:hypothetical protein